MKNEKYRQYLSWGLTAAAALAVSILLVFIIIRFRYLQGVAKMFASILAPVIYGAVLAYLLTPVFNHIGNFAQAKSKKLGASERVSHHLGAIAGTVASLVVLTVVVVGLIWMLIPQLIESITGIVEAFPSSYANLQRWVADFFANNPEMEAQAVQLFQDLSGYLQNWMKNDLMPHVYDLVANLSGGVLNALNMLKNVLIGIIVMVYLLNMKAKFCTQAKMIIYGLFPLSAANKVLEECRYIHHVFGGFIIGKLLDSLIIGILCFFCVKLMNMPYVLLVSVIVGTTNVIPFFGPFIGAIPSAFLILLVDPLKCLYFIIFIFLLQQFDGNILGPKILGDSTGLDSFWVLFSILLFGGLFGFVGMIIGVPTFAVFYKLFTELVVHQLSKKKLSVDISSYEGLDYIDGEKKYIKK